MNRIEARDRFRAAASGKNDREMPLSLEEAKRRFRDAGEVLDKKIGFGGVGSGAWAEGLAFIITLVRSVKAQTWIFPLLTGLLRIGGKTISLIVGSQKDGKKSIRKAKQKK
jgi:hypothetical protein